MQVRQYFLVGAVASGVLDVAEQVVTGVRSSCEASARNRRSLARARSSDVNIRLRTPVSCPISSATRASGRRREGSAVRSISPAAPASRRSGRSPRRVSAAAASTASSATPAPVSVSTSHRCLVTGQCRWCRRRRARRRRPSGLRPARSERRTSETGARRARRSKPGTPATSARRANPSWQQHRAERQRAGNDLPVRIDHLDDDLAPRRRALERTRVVEHRRRRDGELRDGLRLALAATNRASCAARARRSPPPRRRTARRGEDRAAGRERSAASARSADATRRRDRPGRRVALGRQARNVNPVPLTVRISGGDPSLRRSRVT